jgi:hypothetical protein
MLMSKLPKPQTKDRWEQFERAVAEGSLPQKTSVLMHKDWLGGELWHNLFAARGRMLEYALELERKIAEGHLSRDNSLFVLALYREGFTWEEDELEDFISYYHSGTHRSDDLFANAEARYIQNKNIVITKTISRFVCMRSFPGDIFHERLNWNVQPSYTHISHELVR